MRKLTILIDVDDTIINDHFLPVINEYLHTNYKEEDFHNVWIEKELFPEERERNKFLDYYLTVNSYDYVRFKPNAVRVLKSLKERHDVLLLTNACHYMRKLEMGRQYMDKWEFLLKKLPFLPPEDILWASRKDMFRADVIIDDLTTNLTGPYKHKLLITCFHNKDIPDAELKKMGITRVKNWLEAEEYIKRLENS